MATRVSEFDLARLSRDAQVAGEAFGFDDVEGEMTTAQASATVIWWLSGAVVMTALLGYSLL